MKTLIVLPETEEDLQDVGRAIQLSADRFGGRGEITFAAPKDTFNRYNAVFPNYTLCDYVPIESEIGHDLWCILRVVRP